MLGMNPAGPGSAIPGTVNYVEGQAALDGHAVLPRNNNNQGRLPVLGEGQTLSTADGRVEILLTPGIFLRVDHNSTVKMISPDLTRTEVALDRGRAELEVDALYKQNDLRIDDGSTQAKILKNGLYEFDANGSAAPDVRVFDGRLAVSESQDAKWVEVGSGHQLALAGSTAKPQHFDKVAAEDDLYSWSSLRADYLGQANASLLNAEYAGAPGLYPGWAWDPYLLGYTWLPGDGFLYSPFGFGFYSPAFFYGGGFGFYRGGYYRAGGGGYGGFHGAESGGGFHGAGGGFHGGGGHR
jgi:uncharacterized membrane protein YgcG